MFGETIRTDSCRGLPLSGAKYLESLAQAITTAILMVLILRMWRVSLIVPFNYREDSIFYLVLVKSIASGEWIWFNNQLGAPFGLNFAAFPQNITFTSSVMWVISWFTSEPGLIINLFWIIATVATSVVCQIALRILKISFPISLLLSALYAILPYTFFRSTAHISLTFIFVPLLAAYAIDILAATNDIKSRFTKKATMFVIVASAIMGFDYIYHAFFACFFLFIAGLFGSIVDRGWGPLRRAVPFIALIVFCASLNLIPTLMTWYSDGTPSVIAKTAAESEVYGLKIRQLLGSEVTDKLFAHVGWPLETENAFARLGLTIGAGYVMALGFGLLGSRQSRTVFLWSAGVLTIAGTLLATIGGFGAMFAHFVSPEIRAYNRISVFLAFYAVYVLSQNLDYLHETVGAREGKWLRPAFYMFTIAIFLVGVVDQGRTSRGLLDRHIVDQDVFHNEREFVARIERDYPSVEQIYQLPNTPFPPGGRGGPEERLQYDHGRPYLWSTRLRWSWPSFSDQSEAWVQAIGTPAAAQFIPNILASGFTGLWLDRLGYDQPALGALEATLSKQLGQPDLVSSSGRYMFYSLADERAKWVKDTTDAEKAEQITKLMEAPLLKFGRGFYADERSATERWRWSQQTSSLAISNSSAKASRVRLTARLQGNPGGKLQISVEGQPFVIDMMQGTATLNIALDVGPNSRTKVEMSYQGSKVVAPGDPRELYFSVVNPSISNEE